MGFFSKKLTPEQDEIVLEFSAQLHSICVPCAMAWKQLMQDVYELMQSCYPARMSESEPVGVEKLIEPALESTTEYRDLLRNAETLFSMLKAHFCVGSKKLTYKHLSISPPDDWFPNNLMKEIETWDLFFRGQLPPIDMVIQSLSPPNPLKTWTEEGAKLNMFVSGMNMIAMARHLDVVANNLADD